MSKSWDRCRALAHQLVAHPMQHRHRLLVFALDRDEAHAGPLHGFAAGLGIGGVVLVGLDVGPNVVRRHQPRIVAECLQPARPAGWRRT